MSSFRAHARLANSKLADSLLRKESARKSERAKRSFSASDSVRLYDKIDGIEVYNYTSVDPTDD